MKNIIPIVLLITLFSGYQQLYAQGIVAEKLDTNILASIKTEKSPNIIKFSSDGKYIGAIFYYAGNNYDKCTLSVYDATYKLLAQSTFPMNLENHNSFQFLKSGQIVISDGKTITIFKLPNLKTPIQVLKIPSNKFGISDDEKHLVTLSQNYDASFDNVVFADYSFPSGLLNSKINHTAKFFKYGDIFFGYNELEKESNAYISVTQAVDIKSNRLDYRIYILDFAKNPMTMSSEQQLEHNKGTKQFSSGITTTSLPRIYCGYDKYITRYNASSAIYQMVLRETDYPVLQREPSSDVGIYFLAISPDNKYLAASFYIDKSPLALIMIFKSKPEYPKGYEEYAYHKTINTKYKDTTPISISTDSKNIAIGDVNSINVYMLE